MHWILIMNAGKKTLGKHQDDPWPWCCMSVSHTSLQLLIWKTNAFILNTSTRCIYEASCCHGDDDLISKEKYIQISFLSHFICILTYKYSSFYWEVLFFYITSPKFHLFSISKKGFWENILHTRIVSFVPANITGIKLNMYSNFFITNMCFALQQYD